MIGRVHCPFPAPDSPRGWCFSVCLCSALRVSLLLSDCVFSLYWRWPSISTSGGPSHSLLHALFVCFKCPSYPGIWWWWNLSYAHVESGDASKWSCVQPSVWTWCWSLSDRTQCIVPIEARRWNYISRSHTCPRLRATCHFLFLSLHWSLLSAGACRYWGCF